MMQSGNRSSKHVIRLHTNEMNRVESDVALPVIERTRTSGAIHFERVVGS